MADDTDLRARIASLIDEEHRLRAALAAGEISADEEHERLKAAEVELDQAWDLLRQRRAKREYGEDPASAQVRDSGTVEGYLS
jgi:hypothetical protein